MMENNDAENPDSEEAMVGDEKKYYQKKGEMKGKAYKQKKMKEMMENNDAENPDSEEAMVGDEKEYNGDEKEYNRALLNDRDGELAKEAHKRTLMKHEKK